MRPSAFHTNWASGPVQTGYDFILSGLFLISPLIVSQGSQTTARNVVSVRFIRPSRIVRLHVVPYAGRLDR